MSFPTLLQEVGGGRSHCSLLREEEEGRWQHKHFLPFLLLLFCLMCEDVSRHSPQHPKHQGPSRRTSDTASSHPLANSSPCVLTERRGQSPPLLSSPPATLLYLLLPPGEAPWTEEGGREGPLLRDSTLEGKGYSVRGGRRSILVKFKTSFSRLLRLAPPLLLNSEEVEVRGIHRS